MPIHDDDIHALLDHGTPVPLDKFDALVAFARRVLDNLGELDVPVVRGTAEQINSVGDVLACDMYCRLDDDGKLTMIGLRRSGSAAREQAERDAV
jgi:hypothetical protein